MTAVLALIVLNALLRTLVIYQDLACSRTEVARLAFPLTCTVALRAGYCSVFVHTMSPRRILTKC